MATPLGHALAGYAVGRVGAGSGEPDARVITACVLLALAPDFDFLPGLLLGTPARFHQGITHSLAFALAAGGLAALALRGTALSPGRRWTLCSAAYASHLLVDWVGKDVRPPIGIPLLWPFSDAAFLSPVTLLPGVEHATSAGTPTQEWLASIFTWHNLGALALEAALAAPIVLLALRWGQRGGAGAHQGAG